MNLPVMEAMMEVQKVSAPANHRLCVETEVGLLPVMEVMKETGEAQLSAFCCLVQI